MVLALFGIAAAGQLQDGRTAFQHGDYATAMRVLRPLADQGNAAAQGYLGDMYNFGEGVPRDYAQAVLWYRRAAAGGVLTGVAAAGQLQDGVATYQSGDFTTAMRLLHPLADQGSAVAQRYLGDMYNFGEGVPQDHAEAVEWLRKAAEQGQIAAQLRLGGNYRLGEGVPKDDAKTALWYRKAAEQGDPDGEGLLGGMYENGWGVPRDYAQAVLWYRKAADQGSDYEKAALARICADVPDAKPACTGAVPDETPPQKAKPVPDDYATEVALKKEGGTFIAPISINEALTLDFVIDSGAAVVSIPADVVSTLIRTGTISREDFIGSQRYQLADGSTVPSETFTIRTLKIGTREIKDVKASVAKPEGSLLLGQSFLTRFKSWTINNERGVLLLH
jgi:clan AA aspartic protease (TIGR02281 family)